MFFLRNKYGKIAGVFSKGQEESLLVYREATGSNTCMTGQRKHDVKRPKFATIFLTVFRTPAIIEFRSTPRLSLSLQDLNRRSIGDHGQTV
jgi:hypothetical protein